MKKILLDAREMAHPKPLELGINILKKLDDESYLYMLHRKHPVPLIDLAQEQNFQVLTYQDSQEIWHILITNNKDVNLNKYLHA